jgi:GTP cyclohydrolase III
MKNFNNKYIAFDGDNIGFKLEGLILQNKIVELTKFSELLNFHLNKLLNEIKKIENVSIIFFGGDNFLLRFDNSENIFQFSESIRFKFNSLSDHTASIGIGNNPRQAYIALKIAKVSGKNCTIDFSEIEDD